MSALQRPVNMSPAPQTFYVSRVEDIFSVFPDHSPNSHHLKCREESRAWIAQYHSIVCGPNMHVFMEHCNFELAASYAYPYAPPAGLRAGMDLFNVLWIYDEFTDTMSGEDASRLTVIVERSLRENDFDDGSWVCRMMKDFSRNHIAKFGRNVSRRFIDHFCEYVKYTAIEAELRQKNQILDLDSYIPFRRNAGAIQVVFDVIEYCLGLDLPDYVHEDPVFIIAYLAAADLTAFKTLLLITAHANANVVTVIMKDKGIELQSAVDFLFSYLESLGQEFLNEKNILSSRLDLIYSRDALKLVEAIEVWMKGYDIWSFATERYFGNKNETIKETRVVELRKPFEDFAALKE